MNIGKFAKEVISVWRDVFSKKKYIAIAVFSFFIFYLVNVLIADYGNLVSIYLNLGLIEMIRIFPVYFFGFGNLILFHSLITLLMIGVLFGMIMSLIFYKTKMIKDYSGRNFGFFGTTGVFLGVLAPGCAACGIGLLSALGISAAFLRFLPYNGTELSALSIAILGFVLIKISKDIKKGIVCKI